MEIGSARTILIIGRMIMKMNFSGTIHLNQSVDRNSPGYPNPNSGREFIFYNFSLAPAELETHSIALFQAELYIMPIILSHLQLDSHFPPSPFLKSL